MNMPDVQFPAVLPHRRWKRVPFILAGRLLEVILPARALQVKNGQLPARLGRIDRMLIAAHVKRTVTRGHAEQLAPLHQWLWAGSQAVRFHELAPQRFELWWQRNHSAILEPIQKCFDRLDGRLHTLCEIGCGSGIVIEDIASRLDGPRHFIGLDLSPEQTARNQSRAHNPAIRFDAGDACEWLPARDTAGWCVLTNAGVFEYFPRDKLVQLFGGLAGKGPSVIALVEPIAANYDLDNEQGSRTYNSENSLSHNYPLLLREAGYAIEFQLEQRFEGFRWLLVVAVK